MGSSTNDYDAIVIGTGIGGLTSGAYLARKGHRVLLCEQHTKPGGCFNSFKRKGYTFDGGIQGCEDLDRTFLSGVRGLFNVQTPVKNLYIIGHWTSIPGGAPVGLMTGKLVADFVHMQLRLGTTKSSGRRCFPPKGPWSSWITASPPGN